MSTPDIHKPKLITILGPTGSGKSEMAVELAQEFGGEIISADSRQIYKEMNIGTGKVKGEWSSDRTYYNCSAANNNYNNNNQSRDKFTFFCGREKMQNQIFLYKKVVHHLIDSLSPDQVFSVGQYKQAADEIIGQISKRAAVTATNDSKDDHRSKKHVPNSGDRFYRGRVFPLPFLVGGTAQYIYAVVDNWQIPRVAVNKKLREEYEQLLQENPNGIELLWQKLLSHDPEAENFVQKNNPRRIIRALEVIEETGQRFSSLRAKRPRQYNVLKLGIKISRDQLYNKIDQRVDQMIAQGLENEVRTLAAKYGANTAGLPNRQGQAGTGRDRQGQAGLQTIGYNEFVPYLEGQATLAEVIQKIKFNSHRYVRHQSNWFHKDLDIHWINSQEQANNLIKNFLNGNNYRYN